MPDAYAVTAVKTMRDVGRNWPWISADVTNDLTMQSTVDNLLADDGWRIQDAQLGSDARWGRGCGSPMTVVDLSCERGRDKRW